MATGRVPVHIFDIHLIALKSHRAQIKSNRTQTAELYRRFTKSADRLLASSADLSNHTFGTSWTCKVSML